MFFGLCLPAKFVYEPRTGFKFDVDFSFGLVGDLSPLLNLSVPGIFCFEPDAAFVPPSMVLRMEGTAVLLTLSPSGISEPYF